MAAGKGTRFGSMTETKPKGFIEFNGIPMIVRSIENLISCGIKKIIIGTGYHHEWYDSLAEKYPQIQTVFSPRFAETNSMETLSKCKDAIGEDDFLLLESDIVYEKKAITNLLNDSHPDIMLVTPVTKFQDQYYVVRNEEGNLVKCSTDRDEIFRETGSEPESELVGIHKISNAFYKDMLSVYQYRKDWETQFHNGKNPEKTGYEFILEDVATWLPVSSKYRSNGDELANYSSGNLLFHRSLFVLLDENLQWYEIDDENDLKYAEIKVKIS